MLSGIMQLSTAALVGIAVLAAILSVQGMFRLLQERERAYMDAPPAFAMPVWPLVQVLDHFVANLLPGNMLDKLDYKLKANGVSFMLTAEEYFSICLVYAITFPALAAMAMASSGEVNWALMLVLALMGYVIPEAWVKDNRRKRDADIIRTLPVYLEYLSMCVDAGLNFSGALKQAVEKGPKGAMKNEFRIVLRDINSGQTRADALKRMDERVGLQDLSVFISAIIQAERMGSSMRETLVVQAQQRLNERFQRAEKMAMEAPVKLVIPLVVFIFPLTFIILLFPIVVKFIDQGSL